MLALYVASSSVALCVGWFPLCFVYVGAFS